ncbi:MAG: 50S ribosomal protein L5 [Candidatus Liptonbacteria bacterium]|nr:50S ribosomal protein L5 [Candidatus Liptonbacteria bacterium]
MKENADSAKQFLEKIVVNVGVGRRSQEQNFEEKVLPQIKKDLAYIAGQAPHARRARKSIAGFKIRQGQIIGLRATLRGKKMVDFFQKLIMMVLPRVRDFRGLDITSVDGGGSLNIGFKEHIVFPEIHPEESLLSFPLQVTLVPKLKKRDRALERYRRFGIPLKKET